MHSRQINGQVPTSPATRGVARRTLCHPLRPAGPADTSKSPDHPVRRTRLHEPCRTGGVLFSHSRQGESALSNFVSDRPVPRLKQKPHTDGSEAYPFACGLALFARARLLHAGRLPRKLALFAIEGAAGRALDRVAVELALVVDGELTTIGGLCVTWKETLPSLTEPSLISVALLLRPPWTVPVSLVASWVSLYVVLNVCPFRSKVDVHVPVAVFFVSAARASTATHVRAAITATASHPHRCLFIGAHLPTGKPSRAGRHKRLPAPRIWCG